jgi:hypothetical protein
MHRQRQFNTGITWSIRRDANRISRILDYEAMGWIDIIPEWKQVWEELHGGRAIVAASIEEEGKEFLAYVQVRQECVNELVEDEHTEEHDCLMQR